MSGMRVRLFLSFGPIFALAFGWASVTQAGIISGPIGPSVPLDELLGPDGGSIQVDDKLFDDFAYSWSGDMPTPDRVNVAPFIDADGNPGIQLTGAFQDLPGGSGSDAVISYSVWVLNPDPSIAIFDVHLSGQLSIAGGPGNILITETFPNTTSDGLSIFLDGPAAAQLSDWAFLPTPVRHLRVSKDILANATGSSGIAAVTIIDQTFSQIPEPSALLASLVLGACLYSCRGRRR